MRSKTIKRSRRWFLKQLGMFTGAGAALALCRMRGAHAAGDLDASGKQSRPDRGYRLTTHIRSYYEKAGL